MKVKAVVIIGFIVTFAAGLVAGLWMKQPNVIATTGGPAPAPPKPEHRSWLARELNLTAEQDERVKQIWESAMKSVPDRGREDPRRLFRERDEAIANLIPAESKAEYERIQKEFGEKMSRSGRERDKAFEAAVAQTKSVLNPEQISKYEELLKRRGPGDGRGDGRDGRGGGPPGGRRGDRDRDRGPTTERSATRPAA